MINSIKRNLEKSIKFGDQGFTFLELMVSLLVVSIILAVAFPVIGNIIKNTERNACIANSKIVGRMYEDYIKLEQINHSTPVFSRLVISVDGNMHSEIGVLSYEEGVVKCSVHPRGEETHHDEDDVSYL